MTRNNMADFFNKVSCTYCQEEINTVKVQCAVCPDFDICLQCFSVGAEIGNHRNDHPYSLVDHCAASVFGGRGSWTGKEQLLLLDAVEHYGFGTWDLVSEHVETRTPEEVKEEYIARYLEGNIGKASWAHLANYKPMLVDHVPEDEGPLSPNVISRLPPLEITPEEATILGYKPHRDDFEGEYDMEAEGLISQLSLDPDKDSETEISLKLAIIDMYTRRLRERARRKRIVRDYQLVAKYFANIKKDPTKPPISKEHKDLYDKMRVFVQYLSAGEHERFIASVERERELRFRLSELLRYRSLGLTTQEEIIHYEQHANFERQQQLKQKTGSSGYPILEFPLKNGKSEQIDKSFTEKKSMLLIDDEQENCCSSNLNLDKILDSVSISKLPMGNLLSANELQLCTEFNIQPEHYTKLKSLLIQENLFPLEKHKTPNSEFETPDVISQRCSYSVSES